MLVKRDSRRLKNKNFLPFHGLPMFVANIDKCVEIFDKFYVSSEDDDALDWADSRGAIAIKRPISLCGDTANIPVYQHALTYMDGPDAIVAVQANSPTVKREIIEMVKQEMENYDEVITVHPNGKIYGSVWGISTEKLMKYNEPYNWYNPEPDLKVRDASIDIHTLEDYQEALKHAK